MKRKRKNTQIIFNLDAALDETDDNKRMFFFACVFALNLQNLFIIHKNHFPFIRCDKQNKYLLVAHFGKKMKTMCIIRFSLEYGFLERASHQFELSY